MSLTSYRTAPSRIVCLVVGLGLRNPSCSSVLLFGRLNVLMLKRCNSVYKFQAIGLRGARFREQNSKKRPLHLCRGA